jgi:uncharacterized protein (DUF1499 family)
MKRLGALIIGSILFFSCAGRRPENIGIHNDQLTTCPGKPNCVSSQDKDENHWISVFHYQGDTAAAFTRLKKIITAWDGMTLVTQTDTYLHIECKSSIMGFVDDLEFYFSQGNVVQVRSAARLGYSDFGVNRKRVEKIRNLFAAQSMD